MRQLPRACHAENRQLDQDPPYHARVGALGLVAELGFALLYVMGVVNMISQINRPLSPLVQGFSLPRQ